MPLHDWTQLPGWEGVHQVWMVELLYSLQATLPASYRAYIGTTPTFAIGSVEDGRPDVGVRDWPVDDRSKPAKSDSGPEPDEEFAVATLTTDTALLVERVGRLVAAIELVSPRNKDRLAAQSAYTAAYSGYLLRGVHLVLVDVHPRPAKFSFADRIAESLGLSSVPLPAPHIMGYRVGGPSPDGGRFLAIWRRPMSINAAIPSMQLPLSAEESVALDLEGTYSRATEAAYLN
jgi:hypothetical protein